MLPCCDVRFCDGAESAPPLLRAPPLVKEHWTFESMQRCLGCHSPCYRQITGELGRVRLRTPSREPRRRAAGELQALQPAAEQAARDREVAVRRRASGKAARRGLEILSFEEHIAGELVASPQTEQVASGSVSASDRQGIGSEYLMKNQAHDAELDVLDLWLLGWTFNDAKERRAGGFRWQKTKYKEVGRIRTSKDERRKAGFLWHAQRFEDGLPRTPDLALCAPRFS